MLFGFDRKSYIAQNVGDDGAENQLRNTLTLPDFVQIEGKPYGDTVAQKLADLNSDAFGDIDLSDGQDPYYDPDQAKEYLDKAKSALEGDGVAFPIHLDLPVDEATEVAVNQAKSLKNSVEKNLGTDNVVVDIQLLNEDDYLAATYQATTGAQADYDISNASGWGPDFQDPSTYLNIYNSETGDMLTTLGLEPTATVQGEDTSADAKKEQNWTEYDDLLKKADAIKDDNNARYTAYADAEAYLLNEVWQIPIHADGGSPYVSKLVPFSGPFGYTGLGSAKFKLLQLQEDVVTNDQYDKAQKEWQTNREKTAKEADSQSSEAEE